MRASIALVLAVFFFLVAPLEAILTGATSTRHQAGAWPPTAGKQSRFILAVFFVSAVFDGFIFLLDFEWADVVKFPHFG